VNRTFRQGLLSAVTGLLVGVAYQVAMVRTGSCAGYVSLVGGADGCSAVADGTAGLNAFALATLVLTVVTGLVAARRYAEEEGFLSLGDTFLAIGTTVVLVEAVFFAASGLWVGLAYGVAGVALTLFALKQDRQTAVAVAAIMSLFVGTWMYSDSSALLLGLTPSVLWVLGALAYTSSLRSGESLALD
jgi:hypothetical protein